jgi:pteridine reductase
VKDGTLAGRTALVTGGAKRIGAEISVALAAAGCRVAVHAHSSLAAAEHLAKRIGGVAVHADLADPDAAERLLADAGRALDARVDLVVNSASAFAPGRLGGLTYDDFDAMMRLHAWAPLALARAAAKQDAAAVVNLLDTRIASHDPQHFAYLTSKQTLAALTRTLARELAPMRVNGVAPGPILAPNEPDGSGGNEAAERAMQAAIKATVLGRAGTPAEVAHAVRFLCEAEYVTGQVVFVDGGRHVRS